jgi:hypothetical protein
MSDKLPLPTGLQLNGLDPVFHEHPHEYSTAHSRNSRRVARCSDSVPASPHERESAAKQEAVAGVLGVPTGRRAVEPRHDQLVAAIGHVDRRARLRRDTRRNCSPYRRTIAAAGLSRMPTTPRSPT